MHCSAGALTTKTVSAKLSLDFHLAFRVFLPIPRYHYDYYYIAAQLFFGTQCSGQKNLSILVFFRESNGLHPNAINS